MIVGSIFRFPQSQQVAPEKLIGKLSIRVKLLFNQPTVVIDQIPKTATFVETSVGHQAGEISPGFGFSWNHLWATIIPVWTNQNTESDIYGPLVCLRIVCLRIVRLRTVRLRIVCLRIVRLRTGRLRVYDVYDIQWEIHRTKISFGDDSV